MKDMFGQEYGLGDYVAYSTSAGRSSVIKVGQVARISDTVVGKWSHSVDQWGKPHKEGETYQRVALRAFAESHRFGRFEEGKPRRVDAYGFSYPNLHNVIKIDPALVEGVDHDDNHLKSSP